MNSTPSLIDWWHSVETSTVANVSAGAAHGAMTGPDWLTHLANVHRAELSFQLADARAELAAAGDELGGPWNHVKRLLELRLNVRESHGDRLAATSEQIRELIETLTPDEAPTRARAWHLLGVLNIRTGRFPVAEAALTRALALIEEAAPSRTWILDGFGQVFIGQGAWEEARRTLDAVSRRKAIAGDLVGTAITAGHLALMELRLGRHESAIDVVETALRTGGDALTPLAKVRLQTLMVEALLGLDDPAQTSSEVARLEHLLATSGDDRHYLKGFASLILARAAAASGGSADSVVQWLARAKTFFTLPDQVALLRYWEGRLISGVAEAGDWFSELQDLFARAGSVTDAEVLTHLYLAERAGERHDDSQMHLHLGRAFDRAATSNNSLLVEQVDRAFSRMDPRGLSARIVERFAGRPLAEVLRTIKEEATIIFADLVNFTPRTLELPPEEVMTTVRSLFELAMPLFARHRVRPISYLGDGLLAVAQGTDHGTSGVSFAMDLVARADRATRVRHALGETWGLTMRAGVATGQVVLGTLGSHMKLDFAAIGMSTNLAARLQGKANPGEVLAAVPQMPADVVGRSSERVELKGFSHSIDAIRIPVTG